MARYIDADALIEKMQRAVKFKQEQTKWKTDQEKVKTQLHERRSILFELATATTADVVEVVRCKECKHWERDVIFQSGWCRGRQQGNPDWFCADGER